MRKVLPILALIIAIIVPRVKAQETIMDEVNYNQLEKFIQMAKEYYPQRKILNEEEAKALNSVTASKVSYLDIFNGAYFYRPDEKDALNAQNPYIINGFQFGVNLNLGTYLQKPFLAKSAKSDLKIVQLEREVMDKELEKEVKNRYYNYIFQLKDLKLKTIDAQSIEGTFQGLTNRFEKGEITIEMYNAARAALSDAVSTKMSTEVSFLQAKDDLEEIIGERLSNIK